MSAQFTKHQKGIGRGIWIGLCAYVVGSIISWHLSGKPSAEWTLTTLLAIILTVLGFLAANEQGERAVAWMGAAWKTGFAAASISAIVLLALLSPYPYFQKTITIGADLPLSGLDKANGEAVLKGAELAIQQANDQHKKEFPYTLTLRALDDVPDAAGEANAAIGVQNIQNLKDDPLVAGIVGPYNTDVAIAEIPKVNEQNNKIALVSPSTTAECLTGPKAPNQKRTQYQCDRGYINGNNATGAFFRIAAQNNKMAEVYVNCLSADSSAAPGSCPNLPHKDGSRYKTLAIIDDGSVFSVGMADSLADQWNVHSSNPVAYGPVSVSSDRVAEDISARLKEIADMSVVPDVIAFVGTYEHSAVLNDLLAKYPTLHSVDIAYSTSIMNVSPEKSFLAHATGANASRSYYSVAPLISLKDNSNSVAKDFFAAYKKSMVLTLTRIARPATMPQRLLSRPPARRYANAHRCHRPHFLIYGSSEPVTIQNNSVRQLLIKSEMAVVTMQLRALLVCTRLRQIVMVMPGILLRLLCRSFGGSLKIGAPIA